MRGHVVAYHRSRCSRWERKLSVRSSSLQREFDANKPVTLMGTITRVNWENPHTYVFIDVKDPAGTVSNWKVELGSPVALTNRGWRRDLLKTGESVTVDGWQAKDGSHLANAKSLKMPGGKTMSAASSYTGAGKKTPSAGN